MLGCTPEAQTDQHPWGPSLADWPSTSRPACQHANSWVPACWSAPQQHIQTSILGPPPPLAGNRPACQLASMPRPKCLHAGVHPSSTDRPASLAPLPRWLATDQHASMPACHDRGAGMLGCTPAAQTDQHSCPPFLAGWHRQACQHDSMPQPRCRHARVHPSSTDRPAFLAPLPRWLAINQHASMPACQHATTEVPAC